MCVFGGRECVAKPFLQRKGNGSSVAKHQNKLCYRHAADLHRVDIFGLCIFENCTFFFFFEGFRLYLRPFRSKWIGRAFAFWPAYFFPGLLVSVSLWLWAPALAAISLLFSVWVGRMPRCLPRVFTYTAHQPPFRRKNHPATMLSAALWSLQGPETVISLLLSGVPDIRAIKGCCQANLALPLPTMQHTLGKIQ